MGCVDPPIARWYNYRMKMDEADVFLAKATESLASAEADLAAGRLNSCMRGCYYCLFQSAVAALVLEGVLPAGRWEHRFVWSRFGGLLVARRKLFPATMVRALNEAFELRVVADYQERAMSRREVQRPLQQARRLLELARERMVQYGPGG